MLALFFGVDGLLDSVRYFDGAGEVEPPVYLIPQTVNFFYIKWLSLALRLQLIKSRTLPYSKPTHFSMATHGILQGVIQSLILGVQAAQL